MIVWIPNMSMKGTIYEKIFPYLLIIFPIIIIILVFLVFLKDILGVI